MSSPHLLELPRRRAHFMGACAFGAAVVLPLANRIGTTGPDVAHTAGEIAFLRVFVVGVASLLLLLAAWCLLRRTAVEFDRESGLVRCWTRHYLRSRARELPLDGRGRIVVEEEGVEVGMSEVPTWPLVYRHGRSRLVLHRFHSAGQAREWREKADRALAQSRRSNGGR